mgnify:CR=1 FL=1
MIVLKIICLVITVITCVVNVIYLVKFCKGFMGKFNKIYATYGLGENEKYKGYDFDDNTVEKLKRTDVCGVYFKCIKFNSFVLYVKKEIYKKTSLINEAPETMSLGIRQEDGIKNLNTEKSEKERVKMSDIFSSFYFYEALIILAFTVIGCFVCFFDGISMKDEWLTVPSIAFLIGMAGTLVILSPQIIYYRLKYNLCRRKTTEKVPIAAKNFRYIYKFITELNIKFPQIDILNKRERITINTKK